MGETIVRLAKWEGILNLQEIATKDVQLVKELIRTQQLMAVRTVQRVLTVAKQDHMTVMLVNVAVMLTRKV